MCIKKSPYEIVSEKIEAWAKVHGYDDFVVTLRLNNEIVTELLLTANGELEWVNDWWEGEEVELLGFMPLSRIEVYGVPLSWQMHSSEPVEEMNEGGDK